MTQCRKHAWDTVDCPYCTIDTLLKQVESLTTLCYNYEKQTRADNDEIYTLCRQLESQGEEIARLKLTISGKTFFDKED